MGVVVEACRWWGWCDRWLVAVAATAAWTAAVVTPTEGVVLVVRGRPGVVLVVEVGVVCEGEAVVVL